MKQNYLWQNHQWGVFSDGLERLDRPVSPYLIPKDELTQLRKPDLGLAEWPVQLAEKSWVDIEAFLNAFTKALELHNPDGQDQIDLEASFKAARAINLSRFPASG